MVRASLRSALFTALFSDYFPLYLSRITPKNIRTVAQVSEIISDPAKALKANLAVLAELTTIGESRYLHPVVATSFDESAEGFDQIPSGMIEDIPFLRLPIYHHDPARVPSTLADRGVVRCLLGAQFDYFEARGLDSPPRVIHHSLILGWNSPFYGELEEEIEMYSSITSNWITLATEAALTTNWLKEFRRNQAYSSWAAARIGRSREKLRHAAKAAAEALDLPNSSHALFDYSDSTLCLALYPDHVD